MCGKWVIRFRGRREERVDKKLVQWGSVSPVVALCVFTVDVLVLSAAVGISCLFCAVVFVLRFHARVQGKIVPVGQSFPRYGALYIFTVAVSLSSVIVVQLCVFCVFVVLLAPHGRAHPHRAAAYRAPLKNRALLNKPFVRLSKGNYSIAQSIILGF